MIKKLITVQRTKNRQRGWVETGRHVPAVLVPNPKPLHRPPALPKLSSLIMQGVQLFPGQGRGLLASKNGVTWNVCAVGAAYAALRGYKNAVADFRRGVGMEQAVYMLGEATGVDITRVSIPCPTSGRQLSMRNVITSTVDDDQWTNEGVAVYLARRGY